MLLWDRVKFFRTWCIFWISNQCMGLFLPYPGVIESRVDHDSSLYHITFTLYYVPQMFISFSCNTVLFWYRKVFVPEDGKLESGNTTVVTICYKLSLPPGYLGFLCQCTNRERRLPYRLENWFYQEKNHVDRTG